MQTSTFWVFLNSKYARVFAIALFCISALLTWFAYETFARQIATYSDTLSDSTPFDYSNHTIVFTTKQAIPAGSTFTLTPPSLFSIDASSGSSTFTARNVEMLVNGTARTSSSTGSGTVDSVTINAGSPGSIVYTLNPTTGIADEAVVTLLIGDQTSTSFNGEVSFSTSTGTSTAPNDFSGMKNGSTTGRHDLNLTITGAANAVNEDFVIFLVQEVAIGPADTTEQIPPFRFNGAPTGDVGGTTLSVEMSLETDELATCRYSTTASTSYAAMSDTFESTGQLVHVQLFESLTNNTSYTFYVRCIDDEGNFNIDDYIISFTILEVPEGEPNTEGDTEGDGSGSGDNNSGGGSGGGGSSGGTDGGANTSGGSSGSGGSGGGSGGSSGDDNQDESGGGFESQDRPYRSGDGRVIISGYAFPGSDIVVLVDGQIADSSEDANSQGIFSVTLDEIARGVYTFGIYAIDDNGIRSTTFSTSFSVQGARTSNLSNVNIMPTIVVTPDPVDPGGTVTISGFSIPDAVITIEHESDRGSAQRQTLTANSDGDGEWSTELSTAGFARGTYKVRAKAVRAEDNRETGYSDYTYYGVGQEAESPLSADLNRDGSVNLIDFSILLFHWGSDGGASDPPADINRDGGVSLTDFSIMLFQWTG